jgi:hypothetical protein
MQGGIGRRGLGPLLERMALSDRLVPDILTPASGVQTSFLDVVRVARIRGIADRSTQEPVCGSAVRNCDIIRTAANSASRLGGTRPFDGR